MNSFRSKKIVLIQFAFGGLALSPIIQAQQGISLGPRPSEAPIKFPSPPPSSSLNPIPVPSGTPGPWILTLQQQVSLLQDQVNELQKQVNALNSSYQNLNASYQNTANHLATLQTQFANHYHTYTVSALVPPPNGGTVTVEASQTGQPLIADFANVFNKKPQVLIQVYDPAGPYGTVQDFKVNTSTPLNGPPPSPTPNDNLAPRVPHLMVPPQGLTKQGGSK